MQSHLGFEDKDYEIGVKFFDNETSEILKIAEILTQVNLPDLNHYLKT